MQLFWTLFLSQSQTHMQKNWQTKNKICFRLPEPDVVVLVFVGESRVWFCRCGVRSEVPPLQYPPKGSYCWESRDHALNSRALESIFMATFSTLKFGTGHLGSTVEGRYNYFVNNDLNWAMKIGLLLHIHLSFPRTKFYFHTRNLYQFKNISKWVMFILKTLFISIYV